MPFLKKNKVRLHIVVIDELVDLKDINKLKRKLKVTSRFQTILLITIVGLLVSIAKSNIDVNSKTIIK